MNRREKAVDEPLLSSGVCGLVGVKAPLRPEWRNHIRLVALGCGPQVGFRLRKTELDEPPADRPLILDSAHEEGSLPVDRAGRRGQKTEAVPLIVADIDQNTRREYLGIPWGCLPLEPRQVVAGAAAGLILTAWQPVDDDVRVIGIERVVKPQTLFLDRS